MDLFPFLADLMDKFFGCLLCKHICSRMDYLFVAFFVAYGIIVEEVHDEMKTGLNANQLKFIAIVAMTLDHLTWTLWPGYDRQWYVLALHILGRLTAPIMWFFIAEGYHHTRSVKKYAMRLIALAVVSHFAYNFCFNIPSVPFRTGVFNQTGVVWSLGWGLLMLWVNDAPKLKLWMKTAFFSSDAGGDLPFGLELHRCHGGVLPGSKSGQFPAADGFDDGLHRALCSGLFPVHR